MMFNNITTIKILEDIKNKQDKDYIKIFNNLKKIRKKNTTNWMNLLLFESKNTPEKEKEIFDEIKKNNIIIDELSNEGNSLYNIL